MGETSGQPYARLTLKFYDKANINFYPPNFMLISGLISGGKKIGQRY